MKAWQAIPIAAAIIGCAIPSVALADETYRLIRVIDNDETLIRKDLTLEECRKLKAEIISKGIVVVEGGEEDPNLGVLSCLPESDF